MNRVLLAVVAACALGLCAQDKDYVVYKGAYNQVYDYHFTGGRWEPDPDRYAGFVIMEVSLGQSVTLDRVLGLDYWSGRYGSQYGQWLTTGFRMVQFGDGQEAIVACDTWKNGIVSIEAMLLTAVADKGPPRRYTGVYFTILPGAEVEREEVKLRLDKEFTAAARTAAANATGDPLMAVRDVLAAYLESRGYEQDR
jgi:hypothetical protein